MLCTTITPCGISVKSYYFAFMFVEVQGWRFLDALGITTPCLGNLFSTIDVSMFQIVIKSPFHTNVFCVPYTEFNELRIHCKPCFYVAALQFFVKKMAGFYGETSICI